MTDMFANAASLFNRRCATLPEGLRSNPLAQSVRRSCLVELYALKPGNVSVYGGGHDMTLRHFECSADVVSPILGRPCLRLGERILLAVRATRVAVSCNTNLGIVLLLAPLAQAALASRQRGRGDLCEALERQLECADSRDSALVFDAIRAAAPAGLGTAQHYDVTGAPPQVRLRDVMMAASARDAIAKQYALGYPYVFEIGLPLLRDLRLRWRSELWAAAGVYMEFLARFPDTHICRKLGAIIAENISTEASAIASAFLASSNPEDAGEKLLEFDRSLKARGINPGTSADLTVATLFAQRLIDCHAMTETSVRSSY